MHRTVKFSSSKRTHLLEVLCLSSFVLHGDCVFVHFCSCFLVDSAGMVIYHPSFLNDIPLQEPRHFATFVSVDY